jgi:hypothetical protein
MHYHAVLMYMGGDKKEKGMIWGSRFESVMRGRA